MKKGLLLVTGALVLGGVVACGPKPKEEEKKPTVDPAVIKIIDGFKKNTLKSTLKVTYTADYALEVKPDDAFQNYERVVKDNITIVADFTAGNPYLHIKRVGSEKAGEAASTYEALVLKEEDTYKYVTSYMADFATLKDETAAFTKIADLISRVSTRNGGGLTTKSFVYDGMYTYEHREFVLGAKGYKLEDMDDPITYTITDEKGLDIKTKMNYVGWKTDAGYSELNNKPKEAANIEMKVSKDGYVTKMSEKYNDAQLLMNITNPPAQLKLTGSRGFDAKYGEAIAAEEKVTTIAHEAKPTSIVVKPFYNGGVVRVYTSKANDLANKQLYNPKTSTVNVGDWVIVEVTSTPTESEGIKSVSLDENSITVIPVQNNLYVFEATLEGENKVNVVFENAKPAVATLKYADGLAAKLEEYFTKTSITSFALVNYQPKDLSEMLEEEAGVFEVELDSEIETWGALAVPADAFKNNKTWESFDVVAKQGEKPLNVMHFSPNPSQDMPDHYFAFAMKAPGEYTLDVEIKQGIMIDPARRAWFGVAPTIYYTTDNGVEQNMARNIQTFGTKKLLKAGSVVYVEFAKPLEEKLTVTLGSLEPVKTEIPGAYPGAPATISLKYDLAGLTNGDVLKLNIENSTEGLDKANAEIKLVDFMKCFKTVSFKRFELVNFAPANFSDIKNNKAEPGQHIYISIQYTLNDGKQLQGVVVNGEMVVPTDKGLNFEIPCAGLYQLTPIAAGQPGK